MGRTATAIDVSPSSAISTTSIGVEGRGDGKERIVGVCVFSASLSITRSTVVVRRGRGGGGGGAWAGNVGRRSVGFPASGCVG